MEKDISYAKFYKNLSQKLLQLSIKFPSEKGNICVHFQISKKQFMNAYLLNEIVRALLSTPDSNNFLNKEQKKILENLKQAYAFIKLKSNLHLDVDENKEHMCEESLSLLHINDGCVLGHIKQLISKKHKEFLREKVEEWIRSQCGIVVSFIFPNGEYSKIDEGMAAAISYVKDLSSSTEENKINISKQRKYNSNLLKLVYKQLFEYVTFLESLVKKYRTSSHPLSHLRNVLFTMDVYLIKFRTLELEIVSSTYTSNTVSCLKKLKGDLDEEHRIIDRSLLEVEQKLSAYQDVDPKFHKLLREYTCLEKDLKLFREKKS